MTYDNEDIAGWIAGSFGILASLLTFHQVRQHLRFNTSPRLRRYVIRIIFMVPIYAGTSWLGLRFDISQYLDLVRECYEAFVIYSFFQLLVQYLGYNSLSGGGISMISREQRIILTEICGEEKLVHILASHDDQPHVQPFCCLPIWPMSESDELTPAQLKWVEKEKALYRAEKEKFEEELKRKQEIKENLEKERKRQQDEEEKLKKESSNISSHNNMRPEFSPLPADHPYYKQKKSKSTPTPNIITTKEVEIKDEILSPHAPANNVYMAHTLAHHYVSAPFSPSNAHLSPSSVNHSFDVKLPPSPADNDTGTPGTTLPPLYSPFLFHIQLGTLQYCLIKPVTAILSFIFQLCGIYGDGEFKPTFAYPYIAFITNCSQIWAIYCLVLFYYALTVELSPMKPVPKFIVVKAVVFFTFWQSVGFAAAVYWNLISDTDNKSAKEISAQIQDFVVCVEMTIAAAAHGTFFNYKHFHNPNAPLIMAPMFRSLFEVLDVSDVYVDDLTKIAKKAKARQKREDQKTKKKSKKKRKKIQFNNKEIDQRLNNPFKEHLLIKPSSVERNHSANSNYSTSSNESGNEEKLERGEQKYQHFEENIKDHSNNEDNEEYEEEYEEEEYEDDDEEEVYVSGDSRDLAAILQGQSPPRRSSNANKDGLNVLPTSTTSIPTSNSEGEKKVSITQLNESSSPLCHTDQLLSPVSASVAFQAQAQQITKERAHQQRRKYR